jgi:hypothetical protein
MNVSRVTRTLVRVGDGRGFVVQESVPPTDAIVGHESGGRETRTLVRHYVRSDMLEQKTHALRTWDERLKAIVRGEEAAKVVRLLRTR